MKEKWNDKTGRWEPPTNADRIRNIPREELAGLLHEVFCDGMIYGMKATRGEFDGAKKKSDFLDWLKQPAADEAPGDPFSSIPIIDALPADWDTPEDI